MAKEYNWHQIAPPEDEKQRTIVSTEEINETVEKTFTLAQKEEDLVRTEERVIEAEQKVTDLKAEIAEIKTALNIT